MKILIVSLCLLLFFIGHVEAGQIPVGQSAGSNVREYRDERQQSLVKNRLIHPVIIPPSLSADEIKVLPKRKNSIRIEKIILQCGRLVDVDVKAVSIQNLIKKYKGKKLSLKNMNLVAEQISEICADENIKVYIPKQVFTGNVMFVNLVAE